MVIIKKTKAKVEVVVKVGAMVVMIVMMSKKIMINSKLIQASWKAFSWKNLNLQSAVVAEESQF